MIRIISSFFSISRISLFFILFIVLLVENSCGDPIQNIDYLEKSILFCDSEELVKDSVKTTDNTILCHGGKFQNSDFSHSGSKSMKSSPKNKYTLVVEIPNVKPDDHYQAEIWRLNNDRQGFLVASGNGFWKTEKTACEISENGWEKLVLDFYIPPTFKEKSFKVFFQNNGENDIYVDDLKIEKVHTSFPKYEDEALHINIDSLAWNKLRKLRFKAFEDKMLITTKKSYVKAIVSFGGEKHNAKVRLKGDWLDHLAGDKWSFRIKLEKGSSWRGMRSFNIQTPVSRGQLKEWVAHKIADSLDILTTRYEYIPVVINGKSLGIYAYEEHFEKHLVENKNRREGPIIKFSEDHLWRARTQNIEEGFPHFEGAPIIPFKMGKTSITEKLRNQFIEAQNLLNEFRNCSSDVGEIFDLDKMAKFLAYNDLVQGQHGLIWHNLRFYYNPVISKLEPIAYDLFTQNGANEIYSRALIGNFDLKEIPNSYNEFNSFYHLFSNPDFTKKYIEYLKVFSSTDFTTIELLENSNELAGYEKQLIAEFLNYKYTKSFLAKKQEQIRAELPEMIEKFEQNYAASLKTKFPQAKEIQTVEYPFDLIPHFLQLYRNGNTISMENYFPAAFEILGYLDENKTGIIFNDVLRITEYNNKSSANSFNINKEFSKKSVKLIVKKDSVLDTLKFKILPWEKPSKIQYQSLETNIPSWFHKKGNKLIVRKGKYFPKKQIVIPSGYEVYIEPNTYILLNDVGFWSESPVYFQGEKDNEIYINGQGDNRGFTVIQTNKKSELNYVHFSGMNTFKKGIWELTGGVSFYEADVDISGCKFINNKCEDALNIVRSEFNVSDCTFESIFSDAFDSDFCVGTLTNSKFNLVENDAIDFSGSAVLIKDCEISNIKDKAISGGENSQLTIENCNIEKSNMAIASKDKSYLKISNSNFSSCEYGFVIFRKKPEYGPAFIEATNILLEEIKTPHLIEKRSELTIEGEKVIGTKENVVELFY